jgi:hypothetical protein
MLKIHHYFLFITLIASLCCYRKEAAKFFFLKLFPPFLLMTLMAELWGARLAELRAQVANGVLYNLFSTQWVCFYLGVLSLIITNRVAKIILWISIPAYVAIVTINLYYFHKMSVFHTVTYSLGLFMIVVACIFYFFELFRLPKSVDLKHNPAFWICTGLLFYCCCGVPLYGFIELWANIPLVAKNFDNINIFINTFLYILLSIGFLCLIKTPKYSSSSS